MNTEVGGGSRSLKSMTGLVTASLVFLVLAVAACAAAWLLDLEILFAVGGGLALATAVEQRRPRRRLQGGNGGKQGAGIGMLRRLEDLLHRPALDDAAGIHHGHAVAHAADHAEIVGDEQDRHAVLGLQALQELEVLELDGDVERGGRLVGDEHLGLAADGDGADDALLHAAAHLVRILADALLGRVRAVEGPMERSRLVVQSDRGEIQIPMTEGICVSVDPTAGRIVVDPPDGLVELNVSSRPS